MVLIRLSRVGVISGLLFAHLVFSPFRLFTAKLFTQPHMTKGKLQSVIHVNAL
jgi:hypothetical protein